MCLRGQFAMYVLLHVRVWHYRLMTILLPKCESGSLTTETVLIAEYRISLFAIDICLRFMFSLATDAIGPY